jgi:hypothetical protein
MEAAMSKGNDKKIKAEKSGVKAAVSSYKAAQGSNNLEIGPKKPMDSLIGRKRV